MAKPNMPEYQAETFICPHCRTVLQSMPAMETISSFTAPEDRFFISRVLNLHNKAGKKSRGASS